MGVGMRPNTMRMHEVMHGQTSSGITRGVVAHNDGADVWGRGGNVCFLTRFYSEGIEENYEPTFCTRIADLCRTPPAFSFYRGRHRDMVSYAVGMDRATGDSLVARMELRLDLLSRLSDEDDGAIVHRPHAFACATTG